MRWKDLLASFQNHTVSPPNSTELKRYGHLKFLKTAKCANIYSICVHTLGGSLIQKPPK